MVLLDTDHMSLLQRGDAEGQRIRLRLRALPQDDVATTIVSYEEQMRGWLARLARASTPERQIFDYGEAKNLMRDYCSIAVLDFDSDAAAEFQRLRAHRRLVSLSRLRGNRLLQKIFLHFCLKFANLAQFLQ